MTDPGADGLAARYGFLDTLPARLLDPVVNHPVGALAPRVRGVLRLREALLSGRLPPAGALAWPDDALRAAVLDALASSGIARHCDANPDLADEVVHTVLDLTRATHQRFERMVAALTADAWLLERFTREVTLPGDKPDLPPATSAAERLVGDADWERMKKAARVILAEAAAEATERRGPSWDERVRRWSELKRELVEAQRAEARRRAVGVQADDARRSLRGHLARHWGERVGDWDAIEAMLGGVCDARGRERRPFTRGMLRAIGVEHAARFRSVMAGIPALGALLRSLGRGRESDDDAQPAELEREGGPIRRTVTREREARDDGRVEVRGVERSAEVARMLASEAVLRANPTLRLLWGARYAERALMTYHAESVFTARIQTAQGFTRGLDARHRRADRGPIVVVLDTSDSMRGAPELLAKAVVLQALCLAQLEGRPCFVYNFAGSGQLVEHELSLDGDGLAAALAFLSLSFVGGDTRPEEALRRALQRVEQPRWAFADVLLVTDGLLDLLGEAGTFVPVDPAIVKRVGEVRAERGLRVHTALTIALMHHGAHTRYYERDGARWDGVGDPHGSIKALSDRVHELAAWVDCTAPSD